MAGNGFMVGVVGECGTGKTSLALRIAERIHTLGYRTPAVIDEDVFDRFIARHRRPYDTQYRPYGIIYTLALQSHTPVVLTLTLRSFIPRLPDRQLDRQNLSFRSISSHDILLLSDLLWTTDKCGTELSATLLKSRRTTLTSDAHIRFPSYTGNVAENPYYLRGLEMARQINQLYG